MPNCGPTDGEEDDGEADDLGWRKIPFGKHVGGAVYLHLSAVDHLPPACKRGLLANANLLPADACWSVVKVDYGKTKRTTFLDYEAFDEADFPALRRSFTIREDKSIGIRAFDRSNPPILHRKELTLSPSDPARDRYGNLTKRLERMGLFRNMREMGRRRRWTEWLAANGALDGEALAVSLGTSAAPIARHRTAIPRDRLSMPMRALVDAGLLDQETSVLDYGCGHGDDVRALSGAGVDVVGWDPHFAPEGPRRPSRIVNLGFVLNVIEDPHERRAVLRDAFTLAAECLAVAVMVAGKVDTSAATPHGDGVFTRRGTFQKYFEQGELREFLEESLEVEPVAVAPGLFFVFRDEAREQRYLLDRQHRRLRPTLAVPVGSIRPPFRQATTFAERHAEILDGLVQLILELGREPVPSELDPELLSRVDAGDFSLRRLLGVARRRCDPALLRQRQQDRSDEITLHYALNVLPRRTAFGKLPEGLRRDVRAHFGTHVRAVDAAARLAYEIGDAERLGAAAARAVEAGIGIIEDDDYFFLREGLVDLEPILRLFVGLGERLAGSFDEAQLLKIHLGTGKVTAFVYGDFEESPVPRLRRRIKVDLRHQRANFFDYQGPNDVQLLYMKGRYLSPAHPRSHEQAAFDEALSNTGLFDFSGYGPRFRDFALGLRHAGYAIDGYRLVRR